MAKKAVTAPPAMWDGGKPFPLHHGRLLKEMMVDLVKPWSDVTFGTPDGKIITAQLCILSARWPFMLTHVLEKRAKEGSAPHKSNPKPTQIDVAATSAVFARILKYVYSDKINMQKLKIPELVELAVAASSYKLDRLRSLLEHDLVSKLDSDTVFPMLKAASDKNQLTIKAVCLDHVSRNFPAFLANKQGLALLGIDLFQEVTLIVTAQQGAAERPPPIALPAVPVSTLVEDYTKLYTSMGLSDGIVIIAGEKLRFHRAILAVQSPAIYRWMDDKKEAISTGVELPSLLHVNSFKAFLRWAYYGEHRVPPEAAADLLRWFVRDFSLHDFKAVCEYCVQASVTERSALESMYLAYSAEYQGREDMQKMRDQSLVHIAAHLGQMELGSLSTEDLVLQKRNLAIACDILAAYQQRLRNQNRRGVLSPPPQGAPVAASASGAGSPRRPPSAFGFKKPEAADRVSDLRIGTKSDRSNDDGSAGSAGRRVALRPKSTGPADNEIKKEGVPSVSPRSPLSNPPTLATSPPSPVVSPKNPNPNPVPPPAAALPPRLVPVTLPAPAAVSPKSAVSARREEDAPMPPPKDKVQPELGKQRDGQREQPPTPTPTTPTSAAATSSDPAVSPRSSSHISSSAKLRRDQMLAQLSAPAGVGSAPSTPADKKEKKSGATSERERKGKGSMKKSHSAHDKLDKAGDAVTHHHSSEVKPHHGSHHGSHHSHGHGSSSNHTSSNHPSSSKNDKDRDRDHTRGSNPKRT